MKGPITATQRAWRATCKNRREERKLQKQRLRETQALLEDFNE